VNDRLHVAAGGASVDPELGDARGRPQRPAAAF
jgi:hypothetical protein